MSVKIIAEIGINHNGSLELAKKLIDVASIAGCDYVKFQKRNPDVCVPENEKNKIKDTPWGKMTYLEYKHKIEFGHQEFVEIDNYCREKQIGWFASVWDLDSVDFMKSFKTNLNNNYQVIMKVPSALITNHELISYTKKNCDFLMISTGMSTEKEITDCVNLCQPDLIFHTNSTYPSPVGDLNLGYIKWLKEKYPTSEIGYSGHEFGLTTTFGSVMLGATWIERHITLDRAMWGSDQVASVEPGGLIKLVKGIKDLELSTGGFGERILTEGELIKRKSLRGE